MIVSALYSDLSSKIINDYSMNKSNELKREDKEIIISYTDNEITESISFSITVSDSTVIKNPILSISDNELSRTKVYGATEYEIYLNDVLFSTTKELRYTINTNNECVEEFKVKPKNNSYIVDCFSNKVYFSNTNNLNSPVIWLDGNRIIWNKINDAIWNRHNYIEYAYHQNALWYFRKGE